MKRIITTVVLCGVLAGPAYGTSFSSRGLNTIKKKGIEFLASGLFAASSLAVLCGGITGCGQDHVNDLMSLRLTDEHVVYMDHATGLQGGVISHFGASYHTVITATGKIEFVPTHAVIGRLDHFHEKSKDARRISFDAAPYLSRYELRDYRDEGVSLLVGTIQGTYFNLDEVTAVSVVVNSGILANGDLVYFPGSNIHLYLYEGKYQYLF